MIREMYQDDVAAVARLEREIFASPWSLQSFQSAVSSKDNIYYAALEQEQIVGYIGIWLSFDTADLCNLAVAPLYRRRHVAQGLLEQGLAKAREKGAERILLEVRQNNLPAISFYKKNHFTKIGVRKNYYSSPVEDALIMERPI